MIVTVFFSKSKSEGVSASSSPSLIPHQFLGFPPYAPEPTVTVEDSGGPVLPPYYDEAVMAHGEGWTENPPYFLTAYGLAVRGGYGGTAEEWIASLKGRPERAPTTWPGKRVMRARKKNWRRP